MGINISYVETGASGSGASTHRVGVDYEISTSGASSGYHQFRYRFFIDVTGGNYQSSYFYASWSSSNITVSSSDTGYGSWSSWITVQSGQTSSTYTGTCGYINTGTSSSTYAKSTVSYTCPTLKTAPATPTTATLTESTKDATATFSWTASSTTLAPIESQQWCYQKDGGSWTYTTLSNPSTRSVTLDLTTNAQYRCAIRTYNSMGYSSWKYSDYIYTKPSKPSSLVGMNTGEYVNLTVTNAARWHSTNKWQVSLDGGSTYSNVSGTGTTLKYTIDTTSTNTNVLEPKFRCASLNTEGDQSDWIYCTPVKRISVYVWCPEGKTISGIYINDGAVT